MTQAGLVVQNAVVCLPFSFPLLLKDHRLANAVKHKLAKCVKAV
jgi:hypothetical protein